MAPSKDTRDAVQNVTKITPAYLEAGAVFDGIQLGQEFALHGKKTGEKTVKDKDGNDVKEITFEWDAGTQKAMFEFDIPVRTYLIRNLSGFRPVVSLQAKCKEMTKEEALEYIKEPVKLSALLAGRTRSAASKVPTADGILAAYANLPEHEMQLLKEKFLKEYGIKLP